jgi:hypothetical protein
LIYGREGIEKWYVDRFQQMHFGSHFGKVDQYSPHIIGTAGNEMWAAGEWGATYQINGGDPGELKGYWSAIYVRESDAWKKRMLTWNVTPAPAEPAQTK